MPENAKMQCFYVVVFAIVRQVVFGVFFSFFFFFPPFN